MIDDQLDVGTLEILETAELIYQYEERDKQEAKELSNTYGTIPWTG